MTFPRVLTAALLVAGLAGAAWAGASRSNRPDCPTAPAPPSLPRSVRSFTDQQFIRALRLAEAEPALQALRRDFGMRLSHRSPPMMDPDLVNLIYGEYGEWKDLGPVEWRLLRTESGCGTPEDPSVARESRRVRGIARDVSQVRVQVSIRRDRVVAIEPIGAEVVDRRGIGEPETLAPLPPASGPAPAGPRRSSAPSEIHRVLTRQIEADISPADLEDLVWGAVLDAEESGLLAGFVEDWFWTRLALWDTMNGGAAQLAMNNLSDLPRIATAWERLARPDIAAAINDLAAADPADVAEIDARLTRLFSPLEALHAQLIQAHRSEFIAVLM